MTNSNPHKFEEKYTNFVSWYWQKIIKKKKKSLNHLVYSENKYIYCTLVSFSITELEDVM